MDIGGSLILNRNPGPGRKFGEESYLIVGSSNSRRLMEALKRKGIFMCRLRSELEGDKEDSHGHGQLYQEVAEQWALHSYHLHVDGQQRVLLTRRGRQQVTPEEGG